MPTNKYPKILIDNSKNVTLTGTKQVSLEDYFDLFHHTHKLSSIDGASTTILALQDNATTLESRIATLEARLLALTEILEDATTIDQLSSISQRLDNITVQVESNNNKINELENEIDGYIDDDMYVSDYDATTPEIETLEDILA